MAMAAYGSAHANMHTISLNDFNQCIRQHTSMPIIAKALRIWTFHFLHVFKPPDGLLELSVRIFALMSTFEALWSTLEHFGAL